MKQAPKVGAKVGLKAVAELSNPIGIVGDVAQAGLEMAGYEKTGKFVGAGANIGGGAVVGAMVGGPIGAGVGAVVGGAILGTGEIVGGLLGKLF